MSTSEVGRVSWIGVLAAVAVSCADAAPTIDEAGAVRDSAGVRIVHHDAAAIEAAPSWSLASEPFVVIGEGERAVELLNSVRDVAPVSGDRVAVLDASNTLRIFDVDGRLEATFGGAGEGPGEFEHALSITVLGGDTLSVWDPVAHRETRFHADDGLLESRPVSRTRLRELVGSSGPTEVTGILADGLSLAFGVSGYEGGPGDLVRPTVLLIAYRPERGTVDTLGAWPDAAQVLLATSAGERRMPALNPTWFAYAAGERSALVCAGNQSAAVVDCVDPVDVTRWSMRWEQRPRLVDDAARDSLRRAYREGTGARYPEALQNEILAELPVMDTLPYFESLHVDGEDRLWVVRTTEGERSALVFDRQGGLVGRVEFPVGLHIRSIADDRVYGVIRDDLDVQTVRGFRVRRE